MCKLSGQGPKTVCFKTPVVTNCADPEWHHTDTICNFHPTQFLEFEVWDKDIGESFGNKGDKLGQCVLRKQECSKGIYTDFSLGEGNGTITIKVAPLVPTPDGMLMQDVEYVEPPPKPTLEIYVVEAKGLKAVNFFGGKSDPYVVVSLSKKKRFRTPIINNSLNPVWNHGPELLVVEGETKLTFEVWDKDPVGSNALGSATVNMDHCLNGLASSLPLSGGGTLTVRVEKHVPDWQLQPFTVTVYIVRARALRKADMWGLSDPYIIVKVKGEEKFRTEVVEQSLNPEWNHPAQVVELTHAKDLKFDVYDKDFVGSHDFLGSAVVTSQMCRASPRQHRGQHHEQHAFHRAPAYHPADEATVGVHAGFGKHCWPFARLDIPNDEPCS